MDKIIDFNDLKNKVKESDIDKFENYMYELYYSVMNGSLTMAQFSKKVMEYIEKNNISHEKFMKIQKKFLERYGFSENEIDSKIKDFKMNSNFDFSKDAKDFFEDINEEDLENIKKSVNFYENYKESLESKVNVNIKIKNDINDVTICLDDENVIIYSHKKIDLKDSELNDFILGYKKIKNKQLKITLCENCIKYTY